MMELTEEKHHDTASSFFCCMCKKALPPWSLIMTYNGVFGLVALIGSVSSTSLNRELSEYLGEDTMLALVCKSSRFEPNSVEYLRLQSKTAMLGTSITNPFHVLSLDGYMPRVNGRIENDPQRKLAMDDPKLPDGGPIPGFKGYAVNMIDFHEEELFIQTVSGYGLRETLIYGLFEIYMFMIPKNMLNQLFHLLRVLEQSLWMALSGRKTYIYTPSAANWKSISR
ncbi:hypothetical protein AALP_AA6G239100 [Arabis alpina]|uniref:Uncharacterized protein n=1 Tax=Arabis alpina TaxID=50452 RepID=A0A087GRB2_ARAAL|nr:hypothetical protein AALP_AA6G239100 [Arabis alpina]